MEDPIDEGSRRDATSDRVADHAGAGLVRANLDEQAGTGVERTLTQFDVGRVDHPLGLVLTLYGELDLSTAPLLQEQLDRAIRDSGPVVIDLSGLEFIDASGLHMLVRAEQGLRASGRRLVLVYGSRAVYRVFELTNLDGYFSWCDSASAALRNAVERRNGSGRIPKAAADR